MMKSVARHTRELVLDINNAGAGVCLALTPWVLGYADNGPAAWNAWISGALIALIAFNALAAFRPWEEWANLVLGLWVAMAPWVFGFSTLPNPTLAHVLVGLVVSFFAACELWIRHGNASMHHRHKM